MKEFDFDKWIEEHDGYDYCPYCYYSDSCPRGVQCYGGEPWFPPCADGDIKKLLNEEAIKEEWGEK